MLPSIKTSTVRRPGTVTPRDSYPSSEDGYSEDAADVKYCSKGSPERRRTSTCMAWMRRKRWLVAGCIVLLLLIIAPFVIVKMVHAILKAIDILKPTGFQGLTGCGELDANGEHWVDRDLRRHSGRTAEQRTFHGPLVWMGNQTLDRELGCPVDKCGCFYRPSETAPHPALRRNLQPKAVCKTQLKPIRMDKGRPWCLCDLHSDDWKAYQEHDSWQTSKVALLMGQTDKANPTHQANMHFFWIYHWMKQLGIKPGQMDIVYDCDDIHSCVGSFGIGLAQGLMKNVWSLPSVEGPILFERLKFSLGGVFPMTIFKHQPEMPIQQPYVEMARVIAQRHGIPTASTFARPLKVVLAARQPNEERFLTNAEDIAKAIKARELRVQVVTFGSLPFKEQIATVNDAAGLVGISGSDLVNAMFMPDGAALVEIFPLNRGVPIINPELHNFARMMGLTYARYTSPLNATLRYDEDGKILGDALLRQISKAAVDVPGCTAAVESAVLQAAFDQTDRVWLRFNTKDPITADRYAHPTLFDYIKPPRD